MINKFIMHILTLPLSPRSGGEGSGVGGALKSEKNPPTPALGADPPRRSQMLTGGGKK